MFGENGFSPMAYHPVRLAQAQPLPPAPPPTGMPPAPEGTGSMPEHDKMMQCIAGGIALLGLIILPLVLE